MDGMSKKIPDSGRVVLTTFGSFGDVHPYVALALEMKGRGLEPVIATGDAYQKKIEALGIEFRPVRPSMPELDSPEAVELIVERLGAGRRSAAPRPQRAAVA